MQFSHDKVLFNAAHVVMDGLFDSVPVILSFIVVYYGAGEQDAGLVVSLGALCSVLGGLSTKFFGARCGMWTSLGGILTCAGLGFLGNVLAPSLALSGLSFILALAGTGLFHSLTFAHLTVHTEERWLGKALGDFTAIGDIGRIPIASLAGFGAALTIAGQPGWRAVCLLYGLGALVFAVCLLRRGMLDNAPRFVAVDKSPLAPASLSSQNQGPNLLSRVRALRSQLPSLSLLRQRNVALTMMTNVLDGFSSTHIFTFLPFLLFAKGIDPKIIGGFALTFAAGSLVGKMVCGRLGGLFGPRPVFVVAELLMSALLLAMVLAQDACSVLGASLLLGVMTRGTVPVLQTLLVEPVRCRTEGQVSADASRDARQKEQFEDIFSLSSLFRGSTNMLTPLLFGFLAAAASVEIAYVLMAVVGVLAVIPILLLRREPHGA